MSDGVIGFDLFWSRVGWWSFTELLGGSSYLTKKILNGIFYHYRDIGDWSYEFWEGSHS